MAAKQQHSVKKRVTQKGIMLFFLGVAISTVIANLTLRVAQARYENDFLMQADLIHDELNRRIGSLEALLTSLTGFYQASDTVSDVQFTTFASELLRAYPYVNKAMAFRLLKHAERDAYREQKKEEGYYQFTITEHRDGQPSRAKNRPSYLIIDMMEPIPPQLGSMLGYDIMTDAALKETVDRAVRSGNGEATPVVHLLDPKGSILIFKAIYRGRYAPASEYERVKSFDGAVALEISPSKLIMAAPVNEMMATVTLLHSAKSVPAGGQRHEGGVDKLLSPKLEKDYVLNLYGQPYLLHISHQSSVMQLYMMWGLLAFLLTSLVYAALIQFYKQRELKKIHQQEIADYAASAAFSEENTDPILRISDTGNVMYCNEPGEKIIHAWQPYGEQNIRAEILQFIRQVLRSGQQQEIDTVAYNRHYTLKFVPGKAGKYVNVYGRDDTEQKEAEKRILEAMQTAEAANQAKGRFLATISHEIRTPLNGVIGMLDILLTRSQPESDRKLTLTAKRSAKVLTEIIEDVLDYSKLEASKMHLDNRDFDLNAVIEEVVSNIRESAKIKKLALHTDIDKFVTRVYADDKKIKKILFNLLGNAVKFTEQGYIKFSVHVVRETETSMKLQISVADSGIGIDKNALDIIFDEFTQQDLSTTRHYGGTGLGLAITRQLLTLMRGEIQVQSEPGKGSVFTVLLELRKSREHTAETRVIPINQTASIPQGTTVLLVEDNEINQQATATMLRHLGCRVEVVSNGQEAVQAVQRTMYEFVLMDCHMPVMDGFEAAKRIRQISDAIVIALTADVTTTTRQKCVNAGMHDYVSKPCETAQLQRLLLKWIQRKSGKTASLIDA